MRATALSPSSPVLKLYHFRFQLPDFYQVILYLSENNVGKVMTIKRGELHEYCRNDG